MISASSMSAGAATRTKPFGKPMPQLRAHGQARGYTDNEGHGIGVEIVDIRAVDKSLGAKAEHGRSILPGKANILQLEERPGQGDQSDGVNMAYHLGIVELLVEEGLLKQQPEGVIQAPDEEGPVRAVPDTGGGPDHGDIENLPRLAASVSAQGDIEVVAEPGAEDMCQRRQNSVMLLDI